MRVLLMLIVSVLLSGSGLGAELHDLAENDSDYRVAGTLYEQRLNDLEAELAGFRVDAGPIPAHDAQCNCCYAGWIFKADFLHLKPRRSGLGFAVLDPVGTGVPMTGQPIQALDFGRDSGLRTRLGRRTASSWDVAFEYTYFQADDRRGFNPGGGQVLASLSSPATGLTNADSAIAKADLQMDVFDLEVGRWLHVFDAISFRPLIGLRYALLNQDLQADYDGGAFVNGRVEAPVNFRGLGARVGGATDCNLGCGFQLIGKSAVTLIAGEFDALRREQNAGATTVDVANQFERIVPVLEVAVGIQWQKKGWTLAAGYELSNWFNTISPTDFADSFNGGALDDGSDDLGFEGMFASVMFVR